MLKHRLQKVETVYKGNDMVVTFRGKVTGKRRSSAGTDEFKVTWEPENMWVETTTSEIIRFADFGNGVLKFNYLTLCLCLLIYSDSKMSGSRGHRTRATLNSRRVFPSKPWPSPSVAHSPITLSNSTRLQIAATQGAMDVLIITRTQENSKQNPQLQRDWRSNRRKQQLCKSFYVEIQ